MARRISVEIDGISFGKLYQMKKKDIISQYGQDTYDKLKTIRKEYATKAREKREKKYNELREQIGFLDKDYEKERLYYFHSPERITVDNFESLDLELCSCVKCR